MTHIFHTDFSFKSVKRLDGKINNGTGTVRLSLPKSITVGRKTKTWLLAPSLCVCVVSINSRMGKEIETAAVFSSLPPLRVRPEAQLWQHSHVNLSPKKERMKERKNALKSKAFHEKVLQCYVVVHRSQRLNAYINCAININVFTVSSVSNCH